MVCGTKVPVVVKPKEPVRAAPRRVDTSAPKRPAKPPPPKPASLATPACPPTPTSPNASEEGEGRLNPPPVSETDPAPPIPASPCTIAPSRPAPKKPPNTSPIPLPVDPDGPPEPETPVSLEIEPPSPMRSPTTLRSPSSTLRSPSAPSRTFPPSPPAPLRSIPDSPSAPLRALPDSVPASPASPPMSPHRPPSPPPIEEPEPSEIKHELARATSGTEDNDKSVNSRKMSDSFVDARESRSPTLEMHVRDSRPSLEKKVSSEGPRSPERSSFSDLSNHRRGESDASASPPTSLRERRRLMQRTLKSRGTLKADPSAMLVDTLVLNDAVIPVPTINSTEELMQYVEDKFAHGKLVKDSDTLGQFFGFLHRPKASGFLHFCPPEHVPRVFHHCIMGAFREKSVLQEMVREGQWKQWLVPLLADGTELLDYVIVVIVATYDYVFHTFSEELSGVPADKEIAAKERSRDAAKEAARALRRLEAARKSELAPPSTTPMTGTLSVDELGQTRSKSGSVAIRPSSISIFSNPSQPEEACELIPLGLSREKDLCYGDFLSDALSYVTMCTKVENTIQLIASLMLKLGSWTSAKPPWALPIVAMVEWQNLFSMLEVLEDVTFFQENVKTATVGAKKATKDFVMPRLELKAMPAIEACIALMQKLKVSEISQVPDPDPTVFKLQQYYCRVGVQELGFFREVRDFFMLQGAGVNKEASDHIAARFVTTLTGRKRNYGGKAQVKLKVSQYIHRCEVALKNGKSLVEEKVEPRVSVSGGEATLELGWFAQAQKTLEARNVTGRASRDRAPSDLASASAVSESSRTLPLIED